MLGSTVTINNLKRHISERWKVNQPHPYRFDIHGMLTMRNIQNNEWTTLSLHPTDSDRQIRNLNPYLSPHLQRLVTLITWLLPTEVYYPSWFVFVARDHYLVRLCGLWVPKFGCDPVMYCYACCEFGQDCGNAHITRLALASFPGPAQVFVTCSTEKPGELGIFSHMSLT